LILEEIIEMKKVKLSDVAQKAGVSVATVTRVIHKNGYVAREKQELVEKVVAELGYVPSQKSTIKRTNSIGIVLSANNDHPFYHKITYSLCECANRNGMFSIPVVADVTNATLPDIVKVLLGKDICGIIITAFEDSVMSRDVQEFLLKCGVPVVIVERAGCYGLNRVLVDTVEGIYLVTEYLIRLGHRNLVYITPTPTGDVEQDRVRGFENALHAAEIPVKKEMVIIRPSWSTQDGYIGMKQALLQNSNVTGVVTWSDTYAAGALQYLLSIGKMVPKEISIVGYDDIYAPHLAPPLTSVENPINEMVQSAIGIIVKNRNSDTENAARTVTLSPRLVIRQSSGKPSN